MAFVAVFSAVYLFALPIEYSQGTLYILLNTEGTESELSNKCFDSSLKNYLQNNIIGADGYVYCASYVTKKSPKAFVEDFAGSVVTEGILKKALDNWFEKSNDEQLLQWKKSSNIKTLAALKQSNKEIIPLRYVILANGASGLVVREYIQSSDYKGEISNTLFYNTPHEGTGFADQALFQAAKSEIIQKNVDTETFAAVIPLALSAYLIGGGEELQKILLNLVKSAVVGMAYNMGDIASQSIKKAGLFSDFPTVDNAALWYLAQDADKADNKYKELLEKAENINIDDVLGGTQLLNAYAKNNPFEHPSYHVIYSVGLPSIGNGRRTLEDYASKVKNHATLAAREKLKKELKQITPAELQNIEDLSKIRLNKENIPGSVIKILAILEKYIPETFKSELYLTVLENFSPPSVSDLSEKVKGGLHSVSASLANYSLNFFDEGTFDVPSYSAIGKNVAAFKEAGVNRLKYATADVVKTSDKYKGLKEYQRLLENVGDLEKIREVVDKGLYYGCKTLSEINAGYGKVCKAAEFAVNVGLIAETSTKLKNLAARSGDLKESRDIALWASVNLNDTIKAFSFDSKPLEEIIHRNIDAQLFGYPHISFASTRRINEKDSVIVPYILYEKCDGCSDTNFVYSVNFNQFTTANLSSLSESKLITIKDVHYDEQDKDLYKRSNYGKYQEFYATHSINEFRFVIDDLQPDSLWWIRLDFNTRVQVAYKRNSSGKWEVWYGKSYDYIKLGECQETPINRDGLFIFRPQEIVDMYNNGSWGSSIGLAAFYEDGFNMVQVAAMNKIGRSNGQRFSFSLQATSLKLQEIWPKSLDVVSSLDTVYAELNDLNYPVKNSEARLRIFKIGNESNIIDSVAVSVELIDTPTQNNHAGNVYKLSACLNSLLDKKTLGNGLYKMEWVFVAKDTVTASGSPVEYVKSAYFYMDIDSPNLQVNVLKNNLKGNSTDGIWANIQSLDSVNNRATRALRAFAVRADGSSLDTTFLLFKTNYSGEYLDIHWNERDIPWQGAATLVVQAYDFANPKAWLRDKLQSISEDSGKTSWNMVLKNDGSFIKGINGTTIKVPIWIDSIAPQIIEQSVHVSVAKFVAEKNFPDTSWRENAHVSLSSFDTLKIAFTINENLSGRDSTEIRVRMLFKNVLTGDEKIFEDVLLDSVGQNRFEFVEPDANRLKDGIYSVSAELKDAAGNISKRKFIEKLFVDRTPPVVTAVFSNGIRFSSASELQAVNGYVTQANDLLENRTALACYKKVSAGNLSTGWSFVGMDTGSIYGEESRIPYALSNFADSLPIGYWTVHLGCADAVGNFGEFMDFVELGARFPEIVSPSDSINNFYEGKILIRGVAANPVLNGGDDRLANFRLEWRAFNDSVWHQDSLMLLTSGVHVSTRSLAIWNTKGLLGDYVLRLSVSGCSDTVVCPWVSVDKIVSIYEQMVSSTSEQNPTIKIKPPKSQIVGVSSNVGIQLEGISDTSQWILDVNMYVQDPKDTENLVPGLGTIHIDPLSVSPFIGKPSSFKEGLSIWQSVDGIWNLHWKGKAVGILDSEFVWDSAMTFQPTLRLKYIDKNMTFIKEQVDNLDSSVNMSRIVLDDIVIPAFNRIGKWNLEEEQEFEIAFSTDSAFTIDLSTVHEGNKKIFCGKNARLIGDINKLSKEAAVVYVDPNHYRINISYDGLTQGGMYPSGGKVVLKAYAYNKRNPAQVITAQEQWNMITTSPQLTTKTALDTGDFYIALGDSAATPLSRNNVGFYYGLKGQSACVTAKVLDSQGDTIATILDAVRQYAGSSDSAYFVSWNGFDANRFAVDSVGLFKMHLVAASCEKKDSVLSALDYYFNVKFENLVMEAAEDSLAQQFSFPMVFSMDEAKLDTTDGIENWRFIGKPDYVLKAQTAAKYLPKNRRTFEYYWDWKDEKEHVQYPAMYLKNRYSMGIWRQRDEFPMTVAVLLTTTAYDVSGTYFGTSCDVGSEHIAYRIFVKRMNLKKWEENAFDVLLNSNYNIAGYDKIKGSGKKTRDYKYPIALEIKVFPGDLFEEIGEQLGIKTATGINIVSVSGVADKQTKDGKTVKNGSMPLETFWNKESYIDESSIYKWLNDFNEKTVYWQARSDYFVTDTDPAAIHFTNLSVGAATCAVPEEKGKNAERTVCGSETPKDEETPATLSVTNVHKDMLTVSIAPAYGNKFATDKANSPSGCGEHDNGAENVNVKVQLVVSPDYWNPSWGTNNLANRYVRFDPTNFNLYGSVGYFKTIQDSTKNFFNGTEWVSEYEDGYVSAFEVRRYPMFNTEMNPLLFADEFKNKENWAQNKFYASRYAVRFYTTSGDPLWATIARKKDGTKYSDVIYSHSAPKDRFINECAVLNQCGILPWDISFEIAPVMTAAEAVKTDKNFSIPYPFNGKYENLTLPEEYKKTRKIYHSPASRIHFGINDWNEENWKSVYTKRLNLFNKTDDFIRNPLIDESVYSGFYPDLSLFSKNQKLKYQYNLKPKDVNLNGKWIVPQDSIKKIPLVEHEYGINKPTGEMILKTSEKNCPYWEIDFETSKNQWLVTNTGIDTTTILEYIFSRDDSVSYNSRDVGHQVPLKQVLQQNPKDSLLQGAWFQKGTILDASLYRRDDTVRLHPYLQVLYDSVSSLFNVSRTSIDPYNVRIDEIATWRGRMPGDSVAWKLSYTKDGMIIPYKSGIQSKMPKEKPYPILTHFNMNQLQGNTSFYLTYTRGGITYYKQLNVRVGEKVVPDSVTKVSSMYGNVSVEFPAYAWGTKAEDVTVRLISTRDKNFSVFKNLAIVGPVLEVLPSHLFANDFGENDDLWPTVHLTISKATVDSMKVNVEELKIYKPDFEHAEIVPLETSISGKFKGTELVEDDSEWDYVVISAKTSSFSTFFAMDSSAAQLVQPVVIPVVDSAKFQCGEISNDSLWAGTANGWLEMQSPCEGNGNYLMQWRNENRIVAEHQGLLESLLVWNVRSSDIYEMSNPFDSRIVFYGTDGNVVQYHGPTIWVDSVAPTFMGEAEISVSENGLNRTIQVDVMVSDSGSGIAQTRLDVYWGGSLLQSRTVAKDTILSEIFTITRPMLYSCVGCKVSVSVTTEDYGHNHSEIKMETKPLYPYPLSLALWYPLGEGAGSIAKEILNSGLDLDLSDITKPWMNGKSLHLYKKERATSKNMLSIADSTSTFSVEFKASMGKNLGSIIAWNGKNPWTIGIDENRHYYFESNSGRISFASENVYAATEHIVLVVENKLVSLYVNGRLITQKKLYSNFKWNLDGNPVLGGFTGYISDLRFYHTALTAEEVSGLYLDNFNLEEGEIAVARAVELEYDDLLVDQSCGVAGKSYLRQKKGSNGTMTWNMYADGGYYGFYMLLKGFASEKSFVEVFVNGSSRGLFPLQSLGLWESKRIGKTAFELMAGMNNITIRPSDNLGIAGVAVVSASKNLAAEKVNYGEGSWKSPQPKVSVKMNYNSPHDKTWARMQFKLKNLTGERLANVRLRYYYSGEGESVGSQVFNPWNGLMTVYPDAGSVYYGEYSLNESIEPYGTVYSGNGPFFGLYRWPNYNSWNIQDDPSYTEAAENGFAEAMGIAVLDEEGRLLNHWECYDADGVSDVSAKKVRALAADEKFGESKASIIKIVVENTGSSPVNGFEVRYYFRDFSDSLAYSVYDKMGADVNLVHAGGNLYYISIVYPNLILNPNEQTAYGNGAKFELFHLNHASDFDVSDDPSYYGIKGRELAEADSVVVLDLAGNVLWGHAPAPTFKTGNMAEPSDAFIERDGDYLYIDITEKDYYALQVVNAIGMPIVDLFQGVWEEGEHVVSLVDYTLAPGTYLVLRRNANILTWELLK